MGCFSMSTQSWSCAKLRVDTTVVQADIHPTDNTLLWDAARVLTRLLVRLGGLLGRPLKGFSAPSRPSISRSGPSHHLEDRVRAHIFLCMLAYYVEWHMREAWRQLTFADEDQDAKLTRDPVA